MLRKIVIGLGILVAILPYLGFPSWFDTILSTFAGLAIVFMLAIGKNGKSRHEASEEETKTPAFEQEGFRALRVEHDAIMDSPERNVAMQVKKRPPRRKEF